MSIVPKESIEVIAHSIGITSFSPDVLPALAADVEYRVREIMQEAIKCMRHSRRTTLSTDDVDSALGLRNVEPLYGFASGDPMRFKRAAGHKDLFYVEDKDVDFKEVIEAPLPKAPLDTALITHWLAIEGVQPAIPENPPPEALQTLSIPNDSRKSECKDEGVLIDIKLPVKHVLSRELQLYFEKITELTLSRSESPLFKEALASLASDSGLHPLVPYFTFFVADEGRRNMNNLSLLFALMRLVWSLLRNPHIHIEPYLHQLMPWAMTCVVARRLGNKFSDNHWDLRNFAANMVALICKRFSHAYHDLQTRVTKTFVNAFLDQSVKSRPRNYGAIQGLAALGPNVVRLLVLPNIEPVLRLLEKEMHPEKPKNGMETHEAWLVYGALLRAAGLCVYDRMKSLPSLVCPPAHSVLKSKSKVVFTTSNKRKASMDDVMNQPPLKKLAIDDGIAGITTNSLAVIPVVDSNLQPPRPLSNNILTGTNGGKERLKSSSSSSAISKAWKEDMNAGNLLYFGESLLPFVPSPVGDFFL